MLARVQRGDGYRRMRPQRSRDVYGFEIFFLKHVLPVVILVRLGPSFLDHRLDRFRAPPGIDVAQSFQIAVFLLVLIEQTVTHVAGADERDLHWTTTNRTTGQRRATESEKRGRSRDCLEKVSTTGAFLLFS